jgi:predicted dehydrogenase
VYAVRSENAYPWKLETNMLRRTFLASPAAAFGARPLRAVLIGHTGHGGFGHDWETAFSGIEGVEVAAVADPDPAGRMAASKKSGAARAYAEYSEMLRVEKPDLAGIFPRWLDRRLELFTAGAAAGAHMLLEKPFAATLEEADRMEAMAVRRGLRVQIGHTARPMPVTIRAREMLREGAIGDLIEIRARGKEDARAGGEDMVVLGSHVFDLMRFFAGNPRWVFAHATERGVDVTPGSGRKAGEPVGPVAGDNIAAIFLFEEGVHGYFGSRRTEDRSGARFGVTLYGSKGSIWIPLTAVPGEDPYLLLSRSWAGGEWRRIPAPGSPKTRADVNRALALDLIGAVRGEREPVCSASDGRWTVEMLTGVYQSHLARARVDFPLRDRRHPLSYG